MKVIAHKNTDGAVYCEIQHGVEDCKIVKEYKITATNILEEYIANVGATMFEEEAEEYLDYVYKHEIYQSMLGNIIGELSLMTEEEIDDGFEYGFDNIYNLLDCYCC